MSQIFDHVLANKLEDGNGEVAVKGRAGRELPRRRYNIGRVSAARRARRARETISAEAVAALVPVPTSARARQGGDCVYIQWNPEKILLCKRSRSAPKGTKKGNGNRKPNKRTKNHDDKLFVEVVGVAQEGVRDDRVDHHQYKLSVPVPNDTKKEGKLTRIIDLVNEDGAETRCNLDERQHVCTSERPVCIQRTLTSPGREGD
ncbi:hypothetical protein B0H11DRAFT_1922337 [Mycena galericulata]|nr:hypothetical protein B0H11DRAFT_1922337 [Mycena galericulata]